MDAILVKDVLSMQQPPREPMLRPIPYAAKMFAHPDAVAWLRRYWQAWSDLHTLENHLARTFPGTKFNVVRR